MVKNGLRLSWVSKTMIISIGDWYLQEYHTYIRIYGATDPPHLLPKYVLDKLVLAEIAFHNMIIGFDSFLTKEVKKKSFISYCFQMETIDCQTFHMLNQREIKC